MQSQIWNVKHEKPKLAAWIKEVLTNQKHRFPYILDQYQMLHPWE